MADVYGEPEIIVNDKAIIKVYHPILTPEEREQRMQDIYNATKRFLKVVLETERKKNQKK